MSKFYQYINEKFQKYPDEKDMEEIWEILSSDCKEIVDFYKRSPVVNDFQALFRGTTKGFGDQDALSDKIKPRKNRRPKDTPMDVHTALDSAFEDEFGWKPRSQGIFSFGKSSDAGFYGQPFVVFPSDGFKFLWSREVPDLYIHLKSKGIMTEFPGIDRELQRIVATYTDEDLNRAIDSGHEIMIGCKYYYMVNMYAWELLLLDYIKR